VSPFGPAGPTGPAGPAGPRLFQLRFRSDFLQPLGFLTTRTAPFLGFFFFTQPWIWPWVAAL
jgi:hypothetical protein